MNKTTVKITSIPESWNPVQTKRICFSIFRTANKVGETETINNTQLGILNRSEIKFEIVSK